MLPALRSVAPNSQLRVSVLRFRWEILCQLTPDGNPADYSLPILAMLVLWRSGGYPLCPADNRGEGLYSGREADHSVHLRAFLMCIFADGLGASSIPKQN